jgi:AcrR family transcriptional regulator
LTGLRERNKQDKLQRIREATWALFRERGYDATTTRAIAEQAGIGAGTLFLYARDKADLLFLIFRDEIEAIYQERFASVPPRAPLHAQLAYVFAGFYERYAEAPELARRFVREIVFLEGERRVSYEQLNQAFFAGVAGLIEASKARGEVRTEAPALEVAVHLFALYAFFVMTWLGDERPEPAAGIRALERALKLALDGVRPPAMPVPRASSRKRGA